MEIGKPRRIIEVEPVSEPVPEPLPDPLREPVRDPVLEPAEPVGLERPARRPRR